VHDVTIFKWAFLYLQGDDKGLVYKNIKSLWSGSFILCKNTPIAFVCITNVHSTLNYNRKNHFVLSKSLFLCYGVLTLVFSRWNCEIHRKKYFQHLNGRLIFKFFFIIFFHCSYCFHEWPSSVQNIDLYNIYKTGSKGIMWIICVCVCVCVCFLLVWRVESALDFLPKETVVYFYVRGELHHRRVTLTSPTHINISSSCFIAFYLSYQSLLTFFF